MLMLESLKNPKQWAKIARNFPGRTQHQIKNSFIRILCKELCFKRKKICDLMKINSMNELIYETLNSLKFKKKGDQDSEQTETNEANDINILTNSSLFQTKAFEYNVLDRFFYQENEDENIDNFIKFDFGAKMQMNYFF